MVGMVGNDPTEENSKKHRISLVHKIIGRYGGGALPPSLPIYCIIGTSRLPMLICSYVRDIDSCHKGLPRRVYCCTLFILTVRKYYWILLILVLVRLSILNVKIGCSLVACVMFVRTPRRRQVRAGPGEFGPYRVLRPLLWNRYECVDAMSLLREMAEVALVMKKEESSLKCPL